MATMTLNEIALELVKLEMSNPSSSNKKDAIEMYEQFYARVCKVDAENEL